LEDYQQAGPQKQYECPKCKDQQLIFYRVNKETNEMVPEEDFLTGKVCSPAEAWKWQTKIAKQCECIQWRRTQRLMKSSQITDEFKKLGFKNFILDGKPQPIRDAYETALEYFQSFDEIRNTRKNSIALLGQPGAGKTHLLTAIANNLMLKKHVPVLYFPFVEGFDDLKDDFDKLEQKKDHMKNVDVLFIDDLFKPVSIVTPDGRVRKPRATEWEIQQMYAVVNYRYLNNKPILVSSELDFDELIEIDEALGTRIYQMCSDFAVVIKGDRKQLNHRLVGA